MWRWVWVVQGALDRFGQFFLGPLFTESATDREVNAVDSECSNYLQNDGWRLLQLRRYPKQQHATIVLPRKYCIAPVFSLSLTHSLSLTLIEERSAMTRFCADWSIELKFFTNVGWYAEQVLIKFLRDWRIVARRRWCRRREKVPSWRHWATNSARFEENWTVICACMVSEMPVCWSVYPQPYSAWSTAMKVCTKLPKTLG